MENTEFEIVESSEDSTISETQVEETVELTEVIEKNEELESVDSTEVVGESENVEDVLGAETLETIVLYSEESTPQADYTTQFDVIILLLFFILAFAWIRSVIK